ncbi:MULTISPECIES: DegT/DnrJ/EryC1/StrS aminotransferase family protein [Asticcacaulis]|uniref:DegT/DnrJ/EryC1/StrS family aminotransferase n=1 Tax=Asticcacaulis TaxID=76890 RepID=UPI001AEB409C|nr:MULTISPECIES: DegT/DnrJ/EryC1/StrS aminotransferase family protein [Asticcacaulis]MBP2160175.1 dTDP-4-amino-4,6-dideoxygalactose transaminase [Asticcacaulis solisilvae]MDR6801220.1 dTDP-4-amino-4,6-dideoxygalactose transaminase [Asticcacaulis sp. BE141]
MAIPFIDLGIQRQRIGAAIEASVLKVINHGAYIMGPEVRAFEADMNVFAKSKHCLSCANGTDAIELILLGLGVGPGDAVFVPAFTFVATAEVVPMTGAEPVFVDIEPDTYNIDVAKLDAAIEAVSKEGRLKPAAIIAVDLFGQPADYPALSAIAKKHGLPLISDAAQGFGGTINGRQSLEWCVATATSFYPAKPLGCYGDGGAVVTNDDALMERMVSFRVHGGATATDMAEHKFDHEAKYLNVRVGMNSRLDTIQAAVLIEKLRIFGEEIDMRQKVAARYNALLAGKVASVPFVKDRFVSTWAQYTIEHENRDALQVHLRNAGVPTAVYYPIPLHQQPGYAMFQGGPRDLGVSEAKAKTVISLPFSPYLDEATQDQIIAAVTAFGG